MVDSEVRNQLSDWILHRADVQGRVDFNFETPIIDHGLLTSLDVVELILYIESLRGEEVELESLQPESFLNIDTLVSTFFAGTEQSAAPAYNAKQIGNSRSISSG